MEMTKSLSVLVYILNIFVNNIIYVLYYIRYYQEYGYFVFQKDKM